MRLLFITNNFPNPMQPTRGTFNFEMAKAFVAEGHTIEVVAPVSWWDEQQLKRQGRFDPSREAVVAGIRTHYPRYFYPPKILRSWYGYFMWHSVRQKVLSILGQSPPDVVLAYWAHPDGYAALQAARQIGCPLVVIVGGSDVLVLCKNAARRRCVVEVLTAADMVLTVGRDLQAKIAALGIPPEKIRVGYRGVDTLHFHPGDRATARQRLGLPQDGRLALWVGRMEHVKGLDTLLEACEILKTMGVAFSLALVGSGLLEPVLRKQCTALGVQEQVRFVGSVLHKDLPDWYRAANATVLPSLSEGVPNVLLESIATGIPFVASDVGGIPEIATEGVDRLVPPADPQALADALESIFRLPPSQAPRTFQPPSRSDSAQEFIRLIETHCQRKALVRLPSCKGGALVS